MLRSKLPPGAQLGLSAWIAAGKKTGSRRCVSIVFVEFVRMGMG